MGRYEEAYAKYAEALSAGKRHFSLDKYPQGHHLLATVIHSMATHCWLIGETEAAVDLYREALVMTESLYPREQYPQGHRDLQLIYSAWSGVLLREGRLDEADEYLQKAHAMISARFPASTYPLGHDELSASYRDLGKLARARGRIQESFEWLQKALRSNERRYAEHFPQGHISVALMLGELGRTCMAAGDYGRAEDYLQRSLEMRRRIFPPDAFPLGHPSLANAQRDLGLACLHKKDYRRTVELLGESALMEQAIAESFFGGGSEAQLLNLAARKFQTLDALLSAWRRTSLPAEEIYPFVWLRHGFVPRLMGRRQKALKEVALQADPDHARDYDQYVALRRELSRALLVSVTENVEETQTRLERIKQLNAQKEELEQRLTRPLNDAPESASNSRMLEKVLPLNAVMIDFVKYSDSVGGESRLRDDGPRVAERFVAFIVLPGRQAEFVDLGDASEIEELATAWRQDLLERRAAGAGDQLRRLVWDPVADILPDGTETVYIAPDGVLATIPWGGLPTASGTDVLLGRYAFALVPHGSFLLEQLRAPVESKGDRGRVLAVGDVDYGTRDGPQGSIPYGVKRFRWERLDGSRRELESIVASAGERDTVVLSGGDATPRRVLDHLSHVRHVHFATHGFFLATAGDPVLGLADAVRSPGRLNVNMSRVSVLGRSPFVRSGLALAGANVVGPVDDVGIPQEARGVLTAEEIAALDGSRLQLVVLSACDTSLGESVARDGVLGIQAAFHIAGARNVVASLWKVDDDATAELMAEFYRQLWQQQVPPLAALRGTARHVAPPVGVRLRRPRTEPHEDRAGRFPESGRAATSRPLGERLGGLHSVRPRILKSGLSLTPKRALSQSYLDTIRVTACGAHYRQAGAIGSGRSRFPGVKSFQASRCTGRKAGGRSGNHEMTRTTRKVGSCLVGHP